MRPVAFVVLALFFLLGQNFLLPSMATDNQGRGLASESCCKPSDTPIDKLLSRKGKGDIVFYVRPTIDARYYRDIKAAADIWNKILPSTTQIQLAFSNKEWSKKTHDSYIRRFPFFNGRHSLFARFSKKPLPFVTATAAYFNNCKPTATIKSVRDFAKTAKDYVAAALEGEKDYVAMMVQSGGGGRFVLDPIEDSKNRTIGYKTLNIDINDISYEFFATKDKKKSKKTKVSMLYMMVHEMGHVLGLEHSDNPQSIMYPDMHFGEMRVDPNLSDIRSLHCLHGKP